MKISGRLADQTQVGGAARQRHDKILRGGTALAIVMLALLLLLSRPAQAAPVTDKSPAAMATQTAIPTTKQAVQAPLRADADSFVDASAIVSSTLPGLTNSAATWGDYDNDGRLDFLLTGYRIANSQAISRLYHQKSDGTFEDKTAIVAAGAMPGVYASAVAWGDYDNDGRLDFLLTGYTGSVYISRLYHQLGNGSFEDKSAIVAAGTMPAVGYGAVDWGDYDNDGRLDFLLTGSRGNYVSKLYHQRVDGSFEDKSASVAAGTMPNVYYSAVAWGDYDNDGRLDFLLTGASNNSSRVSKLYHQLGDGSFEDKSAIVAAGTMPAVQQSAVAWGDYDNDGRLDFLLGGYTGRSYISRLYHQRSDGAFEDKSAIVAAGTMPGIGYGAAAWGDYDNDGRLDFLLSGYDGTTISKLYHQRADGAFEDLSASVAAGTMPKVYADAVAWGDYDNDGRLDFLLSGFNGSTGVSRLYHNVVSTTNSLPAAPSGLAAGAADDAVQLSWTAPSDAETPPSGLSYNLRVGTTPGGSNVFSSMADRGSGQRRIAARGPIQGASFQLSGLTTGVTYYWSVQAVDTALAAGPFAAEQSFVASGPTFTPTASNTPTVTNTPTNTATPTATATMVTLPCQNVIWTHAVNVAVSGNNLTKTTASGWNGGAISSQEIAIFNGYVQATVADLTSYVFFGLSRGDTDQSHEDIDFAIYTFPGNNDLLIYENGAKRAIIHGYAVGDVLRVAEYGSTVKYYRNNTQIFSSAKIIGPPMLFDSSLSNVGAKLSNAQICGSSVNVVITPTATTTPVEENASWTNVVRVSTQANTLVKQIANGWDGGAASTRAVLSGDAYASTVVKDLSSFYMFGLSRGDTDQGYRDIDFALYAYAPTQQLLVYELGHNRGFVGNYEAGDVLKVAVEAGVIKYYRNSTLLYTSSLHPGYPLRIDDSLYNVASRLYNVKLGGTVLGAASAAPVAAASAKNSASCTASFSDVAAAAYYYDAVRSLSCAGAVSGYTDGSFRPFANTTRGQLLKMLALANGWQLIDSASPTFSDVASSNPFYRYIETAAAWHIVAGYADGTFRPNAPITRAQLAKVIVSGMAWPSDTSGGAHFTDVSEHDTFYQYVETAYHNGLISGYADGTFRPGAAATRGQIAKIIANAVPLAP